MKKLIGLLASLFVGCMLLISCGGSALSKVEGEWRLDMEDGRIYVDINQDGTGTFSMVLNNHGDWYPVIHNEPITFQVEGDDLSFKTVDGFEGRLVIKGHDLYSADGRPFTKYK